MWFIFSTIGGNTHSINLKNADSQSVYDLLMQKNKKKTKKTDFLFKCCSFSFTKVIFLTPYLYFLLKSDCELPTCHLKRGRYKSIHCVSSKERSEFSLLLCSWLHRGYPDQLDLVFVVFFYWERKPWVCGGNAEYSVCSFEEGEAGHWSRFYVLIDEPDWQIAREGWEWRETRRSAGAKNSLLRPSRR